MPHGARASGRGYCEGCFWRPEERQKSGKVGSETRTKCERTGSQFSVRLWPTHKAILLVLVRAGSG